MDRWKGTKLEGIHPNALTKVRPTAQYVSAGRQEYYIVQDKLGYWRIKAWGYTKLPNELDSAFQSFQQCELYLVLYLKKKNRWGRAIYPDKYGQS